MNLETYKTKTKQHWHDIARELSDIMAAFGHRDKLYLNRLNRLRNGMEPSKEEVRALLIMTKNQVDSFKN